MPGETGLEVSHCDVMPLREGRLGIVVGDVMGRAAGGRPDGADRAGLRAIIRLPLEPAQVLTFLDELVGELDATVIVTCLYADLDPATQTLTYSRAGHPPFQVVLADRTAQAGGPRSPSDRRWVGGFHRQSSRVVPASASSPSTPTFWGSTARASAGTPSPGVALLTSRTLWKT